MFIIKYKISIIISIVIFGLLLLGCAILFRLGLVTYAIIASIAYFSLKVLLTYTSLYERVQLRKQENLKKEKQMDKQFIKKTLRKH
jgi:CHASE2 domain-containing sensor protein